MTNRVRVSLTHPQALAIGRIVGVARKHASIWTRGMTAAEITEWGRSLTAAAAGAEQITKSMADQRDRADDRRVRRVGQTRPDETVEGI